MRVKQDFYFNNYTLVAISWLCIAVCTVIGAASGDRSIKTISTMITRDNRLKIAFGMTVLLSLLCNGVVLYGMIRTRVHSIKRLIMGVYALAGVALLVLGVVTTKNDAVTHRIMASVAFTGLIIAITAVFESGRRYVVHIRTASSAVATMVLSAILYVATKEPWFEFVLVTSLHVSIAAQIEEHEHFTEDGTTADRAPGDTVLHTRLQEQRCNRPLQWKGDSLGPAEAPESE